ncbi:MAG TPA: DNA repair protein RecN [Clostridia bacterium]|nr:DNA repair protein RecN [Clostridia bacterium]
MLVELEIKDFAIIDALRLQFREGLTVFTGETGAGKSIVVEAVEAALGGKASQDQVRSGAEKARIDAVFDVGRQAEVIAQLLELGIIEDGQEPIVVFSREIPRQGRSSTRLNGKLVPSSLCREIGERLVDIHGQHDHQSLLKPERHIDILDSLGGQMVWELRQKVARLWVELSAVERDLSGLSSNAKERQKRLDILRFELDEIRKAGISPGEEEDLRKEEAILANAERLRTAVAHCYSLIYGDSVGRSAYDLVVEARRDLEVAASVDEGFLPLYKDLSEASLVLQEAASAMRKRLETIDFSAERADQVRQRIDTLKALKRKYGGTLEEVLAYADSITEEIRSLEEATENIDALAKKRKELKEELIGATLALSRIRRGLIPDFEAKVKSGLSSLGMPDASFTVSVSYKDDEDGVDLEGRRVALGPRGLERIEFLFSANAGEPERPLSKIASGGELSRVMLTIRSIAASSDDVPTVIFDEVDAGIGGTTAVAVSERLRAIAGRHQVICVTHLAPIAVNASTHFCVSKNVKDGRTVTDVKEVTGEERVLEIARMLGTVDPSPAVLEHAREMLQRAQGT